MTLWESRSHLGGRAFSFEDRLLGRSLDNGPHVMLGCYARMRALLQRLGTEDRFERDATLRLAYRCRDGGAHTLRLSRWPTPLALPVAILRFSGMPLRARWRALRGMVSALRGTPDSWSLEDWIERRGQAGAPRDYLWDPLCLSIMNAAAADISATLFLATLRRAFGGRASKAAIWIPRDPWSSMLGEPARALLEHEGAELRLGHRVRGMTIEKGAVTALNGDDGLLSPVDPADMVVSAMPWHALAKALPGRAFAMGFEGRPIVNVHLEEIAGLPDEGALVALVGGRPFQFLYRPPEGPRGRVTLIAGDARSLEGCGVDEVLRRGREQIAAYFPGSQPGSGGAARVTKEPLATLLTDPEGLSRRPCPGKVPGVSNLRICGDWTQTGLPSTLEGAAESASLALAD